jgi:hypothetical protein
MYVDKNLLHEGEFIFCKPNWQHLAAIMQKQLCVQTSYLFVNVDHLTDEEAE